MNIYSGVSTKIKALTVAIFMAGSSLQAIEIANIAQAVDVAGKQGMFTQRMLKEKKINHKRQLKHQSQFGRYLQGRYPQ